MQDYVRSFVAPVHGVPAVHMATQPEMSFVGEPRSLAHFWVLLKPLRHLHSLLHISFNKLLTHR